MPHSVSDSTPPRAMSISSSASTKSADALPKQAGVTLLAPEPIGDQLSPSRSTFSFDAHNSPPKSQGSDQAVGFDDARLVRPASRGAIAEKKSSNAPVQKVAPRKRAQYYEEQFAYKDDTSSARERVSKDSPIVAELRTNVIIKDEYTLVTDLSHHLSTRYQRPESSIMITVNHSACLLLGGSFEPTYVLTINALPIQLQPTTNKRNAAMIQSFMTESIGVPADRGILKFIPITEDSLATNGMTILGDIERLERLQADQESSGIKRALTKSSRKSAVSKSKSSIQLSRNNSKAANGVPRAVITPPLLSPGPFDSGVAVNEKGHDQLAPLQPKESFHARKTSMGRTQSHQTLNGKIGIKTSTVSFSNNTNLSPEHGSKPRIGKRKSIMTMFRR